MLHPRYVITGLAILGIVGGDVLANLKPDAPLLAYWLLVALSVGLTISLWPAIGGVSQRNRWLVLAFAPIVIVALATTQVAARRAISSTHLVYSGVHLEGVESFTLGSFNSDADVRLEQVMSSDLPWLLRVSQISDGLEVSALSGVEQLRRYEGDEEPDTKAFTVAQSVFAVGEEEVQVVDPTGMIADTLRVRNGRVETGRGTAFDLQSMDPALSVRTERALRRGTAVGNLDGSGSPATAAYERFVRIQEIPGNYAVNGRSVSGLSWLIPGRTGYLFSATPPYSIRAASAGPTTLQVTGSAFFEVRNAEAAWQFQLVDGWRREPSAQRGIAVFFHRNPRPIELPLPLGVNCQAAVACGALSLRRLPPPIPHIALDRAGFDPGRYGLIGMLGPAEDGFRVTLPDQMHTVARAAERPTAVRVIPLATEPASSTARAEENESRWVLLDAAGESDDIGQVLMIGLGLAFLLLTMQLAIANVVTRGSAQNVVSEGVAVPLGLTALLGLVLTRLIVGARVAFFDPFLTRGIETAVGLCAAISVVIAALLSWSRWMPPFLAAAHGVFRHGLSLRSLARSVTRTSISPWRTATLQMVGAAVLSLALLTLSVGSGVWQGILIGSMVVTAWGCVAWVAALSGHQFDTFEGGAYSLMEQSSGPPSIGGISIFRERTPELALWAAFAVVTLGHYAPLAGILLAFLAFLVLIVVLVQGRPRSNYLAVAIGISLYAGVLAVLRSWSENGSLGVLILVIFAALTSVRIGRSVGSRIESNLRTGSTGGALHWTLDALLLMTPLLLLAPLAVIDMGLGLVLVIPLGFATLLAAGVRNARWRAALPILALVLLLGLAVKVLFPPLNGLRNANSHAEQAAAFSEMPKIFGIRVLGRPMDRVASRAVATRDPDLAESLLIAASPGPARDLLAPSIEQIWGARAYSNAGLFGEGLGRAVVGGRGVAEAVSYAENTFSVFVMAEHGIVGGLLVLSLYALLSIAVFWLALRHPAVTSSYRASRALFLIASLIVAIPACYVALSNLAWVPITGQNMPFLGLNAWSDVAVCAGVVGILITGTLRASQEMN